MLAEILDRGKVNRLDGQVREKYTFLFVKFIVIAKKVHRLRAN